MTGEEDIVNDPRQVRAAAGGYHVVPNHLLAPRYSASGKSRLGWECTECGRRERSLGQYRHRHCRRDLYAEPFGMQKALLDAKEGMTK